MTEEAGLVHLTWNVQNGHFFICNCCGCCCGVLWGINDLNIPASKVVNSYFFAEIDPDACESCGLCVSTCPAEAIHLMRKPEQELMSSPDNEMAWYEARANERGIDIRRYR